MILYQSASAEETTLIDETSRNHANPLGSDQRECARSRERLKLSLNHRRKARRRSLAAVLASTTAPIIHDKHLAQLALKQLLRSNLCEKLRCPDDLTVITCKNYREKSRLEQSLDFIGVHNYSVLNPPSDEPWVNIKRTGWLLDYLNSGQCRTPYMLVLDASDVVVRGSLQRVLDEFKSSSCRVLFMSTKYDGGYACMPEQKRWVGRRRYLNAGVYIGETSYIKTLLNRVAQYIVESPMLKDDFRALGRGRGSDTRLCDALAEFPRGIGSDQIVIRYLEPELWPDLKVDCDNRIAFRNAGLP